MPVGNTLDDLVVGALKLIGNTSDDVARASWNTGKNSFAGNWNKVRAPRLAAEKVRGVGRTIDQYGLDADGVRLLFKDFEAKTGVDPVRALDRSNRRQMVKDAIQHSHATRGDLTWDPLGVTASTLAKGRNFMGQTMTNGALSLLAYELVVPEMGFQLLNKFRGGDNYADIMQQQMALMSEMPGSPSMDMAPNFSSRNAITGFQPLGSSGVDFNSMYALDDYYGGY